MISVIVPTYKRLESLKRCVESILIQQYDGLELIVIDDYSDDGTMAYLEQISRQHPFVKTLFNPENRGVNYSRNRGIKLATNKFILFLDSDDQMIPGSLQKIKAAIEANNTIKHFLFIVSDRAAEFKNAQNTELKKYEDWLKGDVSGDFTHVVLAEIMKKYLFFEEFRMFEHLNWLRVKKETAPQLLVNVVVAERERDRTDSLTTSSRLQSRESIQAKFQSEALYYSLYHHDVKRYKPELLNLKLIYTIILGIAINKRSESRSLLKYAGTLPIRLLGNMVLLLPASLVQYGIIRYSSMKKR